MRRPIIGVMGPGEATTGECEAARTIGRLVAEGGALLLCGGGGGVMEAAARGAVEAGGEVIGILPGFEGGEANKYVTISIATGMSHARNAINVRSSQAVIAISGSYGTLSEIALALKSGKKVFALNSWRLDMIGCEDENFVIVESPEEAAGRALKAVG
ncbi:MAG TPA: TIGR00725 family protein [bacterium]|nr:TIGR00725 family protein [bacterium]